MKMNVKEFKDFLIEYEKSNSVEQWQFKGMDLWPIIKIMSVRRVSDMNTGLKYDQLLNKTKSSKPKNWFFSFWVRYYSFLKLITTLFYLIVNWRKKEVPFILFGPKGFRMNINGQNVIPFFQPIIDYAKRKKGFDPFVFSCNDLSMTRLDRASRNERMIYAIKFIPLLKLYQYFTPKYIGDHQFSHFIDALGKEFPDFKQEESYLFSVISKIYINSKVYDILFKVFKPRYAVCLHFSSNNMFAMLFSAHKRGIKTVDLSHGYTADENSNEYSRHQKCPLMGFNTLPRFFWVWDEHIKHNFEQGTKIKPKHEYFVGGNTQVYYLQRHIRTIANVRKKIILLTLTSKLPDENLMETMKLFSNEYEWWIRLHRLWQNETTMLEKHLNGYGIFEGFNIDDANKKTLYEILLFCSAHVSYHSTCIYESILWGNKPILLSKQSNIDYKSYINDGKAIVAYNLTPQILHETILSTIGYKDNQMQINPLFEEYIDRMIENTL